jgi:hypothetical protein
MAIERRKRGRPPLPESGEVCPRCGSKSNVKSGFSHGCGSQKLKCKDCSRIWVRDNYRELKNEEFVSKPKPRIKIFPPRPLPNIDSIIDVPCFGCPIQPCIPQTCRKLTEYLIEQVEFDKIKEKAERDRLKAKVEMEKLTILD